MHPSLLTLQTVSIGLSVYACIAIWANSELNIDLAIHKGQVEGSNVATPLNLGLFIVSACLFVLFFLFGLSCIKNS